jgi:hypothetical protein
LREDTPTFRSRTGIRVPSTIHSRDVQVVDDALGEQQYEGVGFVLLAAGGQVQALEGDAVGGVPWFVDGLSQKRAQGGAQVLPCGEQPA